MHAGNFGKCLSPKSNRESMPKYITSCLNTNYQAIGGCTYATVFSSQKWRKMKRRIPTGWRIRGYYSSIRLVSVIQILASTK